MAKIDYKNRQIIISVGYDTDGQKDVELYYDRFDKVMFYKDLEGNMFLVDGSTYEPTPIPNDNSVLSAVLDLGEFELTPYGLATIQFENEITDASIHVKNFSVNGLTPYAVYNSWNPDRDHREVVVALPVNWPEIVVDYNFEINCNVENTAGDVTIFNVIPGRRMSYRYFAASEDLCNFAFTGYDNSDYALDGTLIYNPANGKMYDLHNRQLTFNNGFLINYWAPVIYYSAPESPIDAGGEWRCGEVVDGLMPSTDSISGLCGVAPDLDIYQANWPGATPYDTAGDMCAYFASVGGEVDINIELIYNNDDLNWYIDTLSNPAPDGYYIAFVDGVYYSLQIDGSGPAINLGETAIYCD